MPTVHYVKFERNTVTGEYRATCSCLWSVTGTQEAVYREAAGHDLPWAFAGANTPQELRDAKTTAPVDRPYRQRPAPTQDEITSLRAILRDLPPLRPEDTDGGNVGC